MTDPTSSNILLAEPTRGSDSGTWDVPLNLNASAIDGLFGGQTTISLSAGTSFALGAPATGVVSPTAGPNQSWNAVIALTGTMLGNSSIALTLPHKYVFDTTGLTTGTFFVQIRPASGTGASLGLPPGEKTEIWYDGTNCDYVGLGRVGSYLDLAVTTTPIWMLGAAKQPYLPCDAAIYSTSIYPVLSNMLGSTFGGNGITTFGVPDSRNRFALPIDLAGTNRVTSAGSGIDGTSLGAAGGSQLMQQHLHTTNDPGHDHPLALGSDSASSGTLQRSSNNSNILSSGLATTNITINNAGTGTFQNMPPMIVFGCRFIKT